MYGVLKDDANSVRYRAEFVFRCTVVPLLMLVSIL